MTTIYHFIKTCDDPKVLQQITSLQKHSNVNSSNINVQEWFFVACHSQLDNNELTAFADKVGEILSANFIHNFVAPTFWIGPRQGTRSPWGSKARDLLHRCAISNITYLEKLIGWNIEADNINIHNIADIIIDPMTESQFTSNTINQLFVDHSRRKLTLIGRSEEALTKANQTLGLALSAEEIQYLSKTFNDINRDPSDCELMAFAQANSEHCRHKIFCAEFHIDGVRQDKSLFDWIRDTHATTPQNTLVAYLDNSAVIQGGDTINFSPNINGCYKFNSVTQHIVFKAETHNHPTGVSPYSGAATGSGGEIRDEAATGRGATMKAGFCGYMTAYPISPNKASDVINPNSQNLPTHLASAWQIIKEAPLGAAAFNNEIGRPNLIGFYRSLDININNAYYSRHYAYHKPIMIAGGWGRIYPEQIEKKVFESGAWLVQLGGPSFLIGLGGGALSSINSAANNTALDFASVQRANPEMQRRCIEVINTCAQMGDNNPILSLHDVGAGGLANAFTELVEQANLGADFSLKAIHCEEPSLSPMQLWSNESQERFVLAINQSAWQCLETICIRERCPVSVIGKATSKPQITVIEDRPAAKNSATQYQKAVDMPLAAIMGNPPKIVKHLPKLKPIVINHEESDALISKSLMLDEMIVKVLAHPTVAAKHFLVTIADRTVGGLTHRDSLVGPRQMPVADCAITLTSLMPQSSTSTFAYIGEASSLGERPLIATQHPDIASRMAIGEMLTNLLAADVDDLTTVKISANWMANAELDDEASALYVAVKAASEYCQQLGLAIPVGKDSLSMQTNWQNKQGEMQSSFAPVTLIASCVAPLSTLKHLTPLWQNLHEDSELLLLSFTTEKRLGGSMLAQIHQSYGETQTPDAPEAKVFLALIAFLHVARTRNLILSYHDISDGGLITTLAEMAFTSECGFSLYLDNLCQGADPLDVDGAERDPYNLRGRYQEKVIRVLFSEELGAVLQVKRSNRAALFALIREYKLEHLLAHIGHPSPAAIGEKNRLRIILNAKAIVDEPLVDLEKHWLSFTRAMQTDRDNPECVAEMFDHFADNKLFAQLSDAQNNNFQSSANRHCLMPSINVASKRPRVAILREQGINGQVELAAAFTHVGFDAVDVTLADLEANNITLDSFRGLAFPGGFSFGDVLGAGRGMAKSILFHPILKPQFYAFFKRTDTFALGLCNGCQVLSQLKSIIVGAEHFPFFVMNRSNRYEARWVNVEIMPSPSIFMQSLIGATLPIIVSHGEGRTHFANNQQSTNAKTIMRYVNSKNEVANSYPENPNGSAGGLTGFCSDDGRVTLMMPHPERAFLQNQWSWLPPSITAEHGFSPWIMCFENARQWCV